MMKYVLTLLIMVMSLGCVSTQEVSNNIEVGLYGTYKSILITINEATIFANENIKNTDVRNEYANLFEKIETKCQTEFYRAKKLYDSGNGYTEEIQTSIDYLSDHYKTVAEVLRIMKEAKN